MTEKDRISVRSLAAESGELIPLAEFFESGVIVDPLRRLEIVFTPSGIEALGAFRLNFVSLVNQTLQANIKPEEIPCEIREINQGDSNFANEFGYRIQHLAYACLRDSQVEAWIQPVLLPKEHPLVKDDVQNAAFFATRQQSSLEAREGLNSLLPIGKTIVGYYLRLTVPDEVGVLAKICQKFADLEISIRGVLQPENEGANAEIAFITWPCDTGKIDVLQENLRGLPVCERIEAVFRVQEQ